MSFGEGLVMGIVPLPKVEELLDGLRRGCRSRSCLSKCPRMGIDC